jgi:hypothetical protein
MTEVLITVGLTLWLVAVLIWGIHKIADVLTGVVVTLVYLGAGLFVVLRTDLSWQGYLIPGLAVLTLVSLGSCVKNRKFVYGLPAIISACGAAWLWFNLEGPARTLVLVVTLGVVGTVVFVGLAELWTGVLRSKVEAKAQGFILDVTRGLKEDIGDIAHKQYTLKERVNNLAGRMDRIQELYKGLAGELAALNDKIEPVKQQVQHLNELMHPTITSSYFASGPTSKKNGPVPPKIVMVRVFHRPSSSDLENDFGPVIVQRISFTARRQDSVPLDRLKWKPEADNGARREFLHAFSESLAKDLINPVWEDVTTEHWVAPQDQELEHFLGTMQEQRDQWHRLLVGDPVQEFGEWTGLDPKESTVLGDIATEFDLPFDRPYRTGRLLVECIGIVADVATGGASSLLTSACVRSLAYDTTVRVVTKEIVKALEAESLHPVGATSRDVRQVAWDRGAAHAREHAVRSKEEQENAEITKATSSIPSEPKSVESTAESATSPLEPLGRPVAPVGVGGMRPPQELVDSGAPGDLVEQVVPPGVAGTPPPGTLVNNGPQPSTSVGPRQPHSSRQGPVSAPKAEARVQITFEDDGELKEDMGEISRMPEGVPPGTRPKGPDPRTIGRNPERSRTDERTERGGRGGIGGR